jgi:hypothetical protein
MLGILTQARAFGAARIERYSELTAWIRSLTFGYDKIGA